MKFSASAAVFSFACLVAAQNTTTAAATDCDSQENACRSAPNANESRCSYNKAQCVSTCENAYDTCRGQPDSNKSYCASLYASCLGENPFASNGTNTVTASTTPTTMPTTTPTPATCSSKDNACRGSGDPNEAQCASENYQCEATCYSTFGTCSVQPEANHAGCAAQYAGCLGFNPFVNGTDIVSAALYSLTAVPTPTGAATTTTEVVTSFTTYCPEATTLVYGAKTYTVSSATTLTITDCPCTITKAAVVSASATATSMITGYAAKNTTTMASSSAHGNATQTYSPVMFTGAASKFSIAGAAGAIALAALAL